MVSIASKVVFGIVGSGLLFSIHPKHGHCMLYGNGVYFLNVCFIPFLRILSFSLKLFIKRMSVVALAPTINDYKWINFPIFIDEVIN